MNSDRNIYDEDELEEGEIVSDSDNEEQGEQPRNEMRETPSVEQAETSSVDSPISSYRTPEASEYELEEGEIISDSDDEELRESGAEIEENLGAEEAEPSSGDEGADEETDNDVEVDDSGNTSDNDHAEALTPDAVELEPATDDEWNRYVDVIQEQEIRVRKFNIVGYQVEFALSEELVDAENMPETLERLIQRKIDESEEKAVEAGFEVGWLGMAFFVDGMDHEFLVPFRPKRENNARKLAAAMAEYDQSEKGFKIFGKRIALKITVVRQPVGAGRNKLNDAGPSTVVKRPRGRPKEVLEEFLDINPHALIRVPPSDDGLCLFKAVCAAMMYAEGGAHNARDTHRFLHNERKLFVQVRRLMEACRIKPGCATYGIPAAKKVQTYLQRTYPFKYRVIIFGKYYGTDPCYNGNINAERNINAEHTLALYHDDGHFDAVKTPHKLFMASAYCPSCEITFDRPLKHGINCKIRCWNCCRMGAGFPVKCMNKDVSRHICCVNCYKTFQSEQCFEAHKGTTCSVAVLFT